MDSLNIGLASPSFLVWCGFFVNPDLPIALVVESETQAQLAQLQLARIGFDEVVGFITADDLDEKQQITQIAARDFLSSLESPQRPVILDVRSDPEWSQDHLEGAIHIPLPQLVCRIGELSRKVPLTVVCASGYRSSIATSLLQSQGFKRLSNVMSGMHASKADKAEFDQSPSKFEPQYGGFCANTMAKGEKSNSDPNVFIIHKGKLHVFSTPAAKTEFTSDPDAHVSKADNNWLKLGPDTYNSETHGFDEPWPFGPESNQQ